MLERFLEISIVKIYKNVSNAGEKKKLIIIVMEKFNGLVVRNAVIKKDL